MKIALIGYGKMGKLVETMAEKKGHNVISKIAPHLKTSTISVETIGEADVCIDFSSADSVIDNLKACALHRKNVVIGTTGWEAQLDEAKRIAETSGIGCVYSPNFSVGVNVFMQIISHAAALVDAFDEYDVAGVEAHHNKKADSPSGTAKALADILRSRISRLKTLEFASIRCGSIPGTHTVILDSPADTITLTHEARSKEGFAQGAVMAAEWIQGKQGFFTPKAGEFLEK